MAPGLMLPGRRDLAVEYGVSVQTIQRQVADLLREGILRADRRRGTFVGTPLFPVFYDHADAAYQAATHLFEQGCAELVFFSARAAPWVQGRWEGLLRAARDSPIVEEELTPRRVRLNSQLVARSSSRFEYPMNE